MLASIRGRSCLDAGVKSCWKEIDAQASFRGNTVYLIDDVLVHAADEQQYDI